MDKITKTTELTKIIEEPQEQFKDPCVSKWVQRVSRTFEQCTIKKLAIGILTASLLTGCTGYKPQAFVDVYGVTKHTKSYTKSGKKYNEFNKGAGVGVLFSNDKYRVGGRVARIKNSISRYSNIAVLEAHNCSYKIKSVNLCYGAVAGGTTGYKLNTNGISPLIAPAVGAEWDRFKLELTALSGQGKGASALLALLRIRLY